MGQGLIESEASEPAMGIEAEAIVPVGARLSHFQKVKIKNALYLAWESDDLDAFKATLAVPGAVHEACSARKGSPLLSTIAASRRPGWMMAAIKAGALACMARPRKDELAEECLAVGAMEEALRIFQAGADPMRACGANPLVRGYPLDLARGHAGLTALLAPKVFAAAQRGDAHAMVSLLAASKHVDEAVERGDPARAPAKAILDPLIEGAKVHSAQYRRAHAEVWQGFPLPSKEESAASTAALSAMPFVNEADLDAKPVKEFLRLLLAETALLRGQVASMGEEISLLKARLDPARPHEAPDMAASDALDALAAKIGGSREGLIPLAAKPGTVARPRR